MLALDFLGVAFAWTMHVGVQMPSVGAPIIGGVAGQPEGLQQRFELQKDLVFAAPKDRGQNLASVVIDGMPEPTRVAFVPDKRPHLIHLRLRFPARSRSQATSSGCSVRSNAVFTDSSTASFFLSSRSTVLGQICNDRAVSRTPLALRLMSMIVCFTSGKHPRLQ